MNNKISNILFLGYYADVESRCQVFRVCATTDLTGKGKSVSQINFNGKKT